MAEAVTLWSHALGAIAFAALALAAGRRPAGLPRAPLAATLALVALWALASAGIGPGDAATRLVEGLRTLALLCLMAVLHRRATGGRLPVGIASCYGAVALLVVLCLGLRLVAGAVEPAAARAMDSAALTLRLVAAVAASMLACGLNGAASRKGERSLAIALGALWLLEAGIFLVTLIAGGWRPEFSALRGIALVAVAALTGIALLRPDGRPMGLSRATTLQALVLAAAAIYVVALALAGLALEALAGAYARALQTVLVFGTSAAGLAFLSTPRLRAWLRVVLAKHLFRHRYDYRAEWIRFTETLGTPAGSAPLEERVVKAVADLTDSPAGLLLTPHDGALVRTGGWRWDAADLPEEAGTALAAHLEATGRVVEIDAVRTGRAGSRDAAALPQWMVDMPDAWAIVPLMHLGRLSGAILLARPPVARSLDWEDFDLLRIAGRQVASYLAEWRAQSELMEARRFEEFNRRFAFILHDIKNLVSQVSLVARNAERHADNPEFRKDMIATLRETAGRMNDLLARLSQHSVSRPEAMAAVEVLALVERVAATRRAAHPVVTSGTAAVARADAARLEVLLGHLVQNAIEASPPAEPVTLAVSSTGSAVLVDVIDRGCGMAPAFVRDQLFRPFVSSKPGGFGIGAYEARQLAAAMGGTLEVTSREGAGTRFRLTLPAPSATGQPFDRAA